MKIKIFREDERPHTIFMEGVNIKFVHGVAELEVSHRIGFSIIKKLQERKDLVFTVL